MSLLLLTGNIHAKMKPQGWRDKGYTDTQQQSLLEISCRYFHGDVAVCDDDEIFPRLSARASPF
jgi:hypothetical protein